MISTCDISKEIKFKIDNQIVSATWFQHHKLGKSETMAILKLINHSKEHYNMNSKIWRKIWRNYSRKKEKAIFIQRK